MESRPPPSALARNDTQAPLLLGINGGFLLLSIILLSARLSSRMRPISNLKADDWTVLGGTVLATTNFFIQCAACAHGFGRRSAFVPRADRRSALRLLFTMQVVWYWSITLTKLSVALLLLRLKPGRYWKLFLHSTIALLLLTVCVQTCFQFLQCRPFAVYWDPRLLRGVKCIPRAVINGNIIANSTVHVATDLVFSFMPITFISKLHRPRGEKIFLSILMGLGLFASTFAILRTAGLANLYVERDFLKMNVMPTLWASLEQEVALIAATIPTLKNFMQRVLVRVGQYCYEEESEMRVKSKLMQMGWLGVGDVDEGAVRMGRKPSKPDIESEVLTFGSPRVGKRRDEFGDSILVVEKEVAVETVVGGKGRDVGLERIGAGRGKEYGV